MMTRGVRAAASASVLAMVVASGVLIVADQQMPALTAAEQKEGWKLLFDGKSLGGWQGYKGRPTSGWKAVDGVLSREAGGGDLVSAEQFANFELRLEWKLNKGGNSGIFFHVTDEGDEAWHSGPEFQVLDNGGHKDGANPLTSAGSNYAVHAPVRDVTKPIGEWNSVRLIVRGTHVEHWMNDVKLLEYEFGSPDWAARVKASKFDKIPIYGKARTGRIGLQDHGGPVWYRNIKIRPL
jgi:3-keto-disaccharide hydrolase